MQAARQGVRGGRRHHDVRGSYAVKAYIQSKPASKTLHVLAATPTSTLPLHPTESVARSGIHERPLRMSLHVDSPSISGITEAMVGLTVPCEKAQEGGELNGLLPL